MTTCIKNLIYSISKALNQSRVRVSCRLLISIEKHLHSNCKDENKSNSVMLKTLFLLPQKKAKTVLTFCLKESW